MRGGRLSVVASSSASTNSLIVQVPVCGNIASLVYFVIVYIKQSASIAPGTRAVIWELAALSAVDFGEVCCPLQFSGWADSKVKTALREEPQCVSQILVLAFSGWYEMKASNLSK